jgi:predicted nucleic acid-binding protein
MRTYLDSGVLIAAARGNHDVSTPALDVLSDPARIFVSSAFVRLEVLPKPRYLQRRMESEFYETFFAAVSDWASPSEALVEMAFGYAATYGLAALDALHVAAALSLHAEELVTTEQEGKPIHRVTGIRVISLKPPSSSS